MLEELLDSSPAVQERLYQLSDKVLLCQCPLSAPCHRDVLIRAWVKQFLNDELERSDEEAARAEELFRAAELRQQVEEPESQSDDERGQEPRGAGWRGEGELLCVCVSRSNW